MKIDWPSKDGFCCFQVASYVVRDKEEEESEVEVLKVITACYITYFSISCTVTMSNSTNFSLPPLYCVFISHLFGFLLVSKF